MPIIGRKSHTKDGQKIYIRIGESPPAIKDGKVQEGAFFIILGDDMGEKSIRLTDQEAIDLANRIITIYQLHVRMYRKLDKKTYEEYKQSHTANNEKIEHEIVKFLLKSGGQCTIEDIRESLSVKHADYLTHLEKEGVVKIKGNNVFLNFGERENENDINDKST
ncbi:hypothetical protein [Acidianus manzaensis]|uniref:Uncharacterized protein n=1 Tax=Acidianus manzaensis TaxID=282676 RepID=A0A1W6K2S2_9CREN|nr:hypothetical protein [Acidianus manzaensis]ARM76790.1 hypothetical protein B6F84_12695 [Acidianus manzaensis]